MTTTEIVNKLALKCCGIFSAYSEQKECACKWLRLTPKNNCQICKCSFSTKVGTGKLGRISTENLFQTSNREGNATTLALMCASIAIVINKMSHLSDRVCNSCGRKERNLFQLFNLVKNSTKKIASRVQIVSNCNYRLLFRPLREALQIAKCFEQAYMQLPLNIHHEKRCFLQCKNGININHQSTR